MSKSLKVPSKTKASYFQDLVKQKKAFKEFKKFFNRSFIIKVSELLLGIVNGLYT